jgi:ribose/xylose/arabinose/galactoside ABC-type transport system permease subunit
MVRGEEKATPWAFERIALIGLIAFGSAILIVYSTTDLSVIVIGAASGMLIARVGSSSQRARKFGCALGCLVGLLIPVVWNFVIYITDNSTGVRD